MDPELPAWPDDKVMKLVLTNNVVYGYATGSPSAQGGAERFQWLLSQALTEAGWSVVVGVRDLITPGQEEVINGVKFVGMKRGNFIRSWSKLLNDHRPDWFFWRAADPLWGALLLVARMKGVRGIFSAAYDTDVMPRRALVRHRRLWPLYTWGLSTVDRIFVQHRDQFSNLAPRLQTKARILPGLVVLPREVKSRKERGNYIVWVAVLRPHKRPELLIEMARATPDLNYVVCGGRTAFGTPAEYSDKILRDLSSLPNLQHLGDVPHDRTLDLIANATALVSTSDQEGFPNIFLEAWAAGTPVVSLKIDPDDMIKEKGLGFVSGTVEQAVADIRNIIQSPETFDTISRKARFHAEAIYSKEAVVNLFMQAVLKSEMRPLQ